MEHICEECKETWKSNRQNKTGLCQKCYRRNLSRKHYRSNPEVRQKSKLRSRQQGYSKQWAKRNPDKVRKYNRNFKNKHKDDKYYYSTEYARKYRKARYAEDIDFRIRSLLRSRLNGVINRLFEKKSGSAVRSLGCTLIQFRAHLKSQFYKHPKKGVIMSWDNYGKSSGKPYWEIDHIIPLSRVDLENPNTLEQVCHYTNLQPLWKIDNVRKANKLPEEL